MPAQGAAAGGGLTDAEILAALCEERYTLAGADAAGKYLKEYTDYCTADGAKWLAVEAGGFAGAKIATDPATPYAGVTGA
jgi:hypothetical protein